MTTNRLEESNGAVAAEVVEETLERTPVRQPASVNEILAIDNESRVCARELVTARTVAVTA